jgi:hypothetical protein
MAAKKNNAETQPVTEEPKKKGPPPLWTYYRVSFNFVTRLCGSVPADPEIMKPWLEARAPKVRAPGGKSINEIQEEVFASLPEIPEGEEEQLSMLVFQRNNGGCVIRAATVRAHIKSLCV